MPADPAPRGPNPIGRPAVMSTAASTSAAAFVFWREQAMRLNQRQAGDRLSYSRDQVQHFEAGTTRGRNPRPAPVPLAVGYAMTAMYVGLPPWTDDGSGRAPDASGLPVRVLDRLRSAFQKILEEEGIDPSPLA